MVVKLKIGHRVSQWLQLEGDPLLDDLKGAGFLKLKYLPTFTMTIHAQHVNVANFIAASIQCSKPQDTRGTQTFRWFYEETGRRRMHL